MRVPLDAGVFDPTRSVVESAKGTVTLSPAETKLLSYFASHPQQTVSYEQLLIDVWGYAARVHSRTVYTTINRLRAKIERDPKSPRHIIAITGLGYRFVPAESSEGEQPIEAHAGLVTFGRRPEIAAVEGLLLEGARLVALVGPGGVGKTHLAKRILERTKSESAFVSFAECRDAASVRAQLAAALGVSRDTDTSIAEALAARGAWLLIADNVEQIAVPFAELASAWLAAAQALQILVTSREGLQLDSERVVMIEPLEVPAPGAEDAARCPSLALFLARLRPLRPDFVVDTEAIAAAAEIVRRLDGLPLAIELAAARAATMSLGEILERIQRRFDLLTGTRRDTSARQATLRSAIAWSWGLLEPDEQLAFAQLSVFRGGFTLPAAEAVLDLSAVADAQPVIDVLASLAQRSLVRATSQPAGGVRYSMLESIAAYAADRLAQLAAIPSAPDATGLQATGQAQIRHGRCYAALCDPRRVLPPGDQRLLPECDNLDIAIARALERRDGEIAAGALHGLHRALAQSGRDSARLVALAQQVRALPDLPPRARALVTSDLGRILSARFDGQAIGILAEAVAACEAEGLEALASETASLLGQSLVFGHRAEEALAILQRERQRAERAGRSSARIWHRIGVALHKLGRLAEAISAFERARALGIEAGDGWTEAAAESSLGILTRQQGDVQRALQHHERARQRYEAIGEQRALIAVQLNLAIALNESGRPSEGRPHAEQARLLARRMGEPIHAAFAAHALAETLTDDPARQRVLFEEVLAIADAHQVLSLAAASRAALGDLDIREGRRTDGIARLREAISMFRSGGEPRYLECALRQLAAELGPDDRAEAIAALAEADAIAGRSSAVDHGSQSTISSSG